MFPRLFVLLRGFPRWLDRGHLFIATAIGTHPIVAAPHSYPPPRPMLPRLPQLRRRLHRHPPPPPTLTLLTAPTPSPRPRRRPPPTEVPTLPGRHPPLGSVEPAPPQQPETLRSAALTTTPAAGTGYLRPTHLPPLPLP